MTDRPRVLGIGVAVLAGACAAVQAHVNGELGARLHDGFAAALISFGVGLVLIATIAAAMPTARRGAGELRAALRGGSIRPWQCLGGACGAMLVASQGLTVATLGVAIFTVAVVGGQSVASLLVDRVGLGPAGPQALRGTRVAGAALTVVAVVVAVADHLTAPTALVLAALPLLAGASSAVQQAINGRVRAAARSVTTATLLNFIVGTTVLALAFGVDLLIRGTPKGTLPAQPWLYTGGAIGVVFIAAAAAFVRHTGVLLFGLGTIAGQLIGAIGVDSLVPGGARPTAYTLAGTALTLVAVAIAAAPARRAALPTGGTAPDRTAADPMPESSGAGD